MNLLGVDSYLQMIIKGFIIIIAVLADSLSKKQKTGIKIMASAFDAKR
jgi:inositol transport system permease protein